METRSANPDFSSSRKEPVVLAHPHEDIPRYEPWLGVALLSVVPAAAIFFLPAAFLWPLIGLTGAIFAVSFVLLLRQERRRPRT